MNEKLCCVCKETGHLRTCRGVAAYFFDHCHSHEQVDWEACPQGGNSIKVARDVLTESDRRLGEEIRRNKRLVDGWNLWDILKKDKPIRDMITTAKEAKAKVDELEANDG